MAKKNIIEQLKEDYTKLSKVITEGYVFDGEAVDDVPTEQDVPMDSETPMDNPEIGMEEPSQDDASMDRVAQIRKVAIDGIQEYADDINNPLYEFYKRIFNECDKVMTDKIKATQGK